MVGGLQLLNVPVSYLCLKLGAMPEATVIVAIVLSQICLFARLSMLSRATGFHTGAYLREVYIPVIFKVCAASVVLPSILEFVLPQNIWGFIISVAACVMCVAASVYVLGMTPDERQWLRGMICRIFVRK